MYEQFCTAILSALLVNGPKKKKRILFLSFVCVHHSSINWIVEMENEICILFYDRFSLSNKNIRGLIESAIVYSSLVRLTWVSFIMMCFSTQKQNNFRNTKNAIFRVQTREKIKNYNFFYSTYNKQSSRYQSWIETFSVNHK